MMRFAVILSGCLMLAACTAEVSTGERSPCYGQFRAQGKYFTTARAADGSNVVVSTMSAPTGCGK